MKKLKKVGWFLLGGMAVLVLEAIGVAAWVFVGEPEPAPMPEMYAWGGGQVAAASQSTRPAPGAEPDPTLASRPAAQPDDFNVVWGPGGQTLALDFLGRTLRYPPDAASGTFPGPADPQQFQIQKQWPLVTLWSRWSVDKTAWPAEHRARVLDLLLMRICDTSGYPRAYPKIVRKTTYREPPAFLNKDWTPLVEEFGRRMSGRQVSYTIDCIGGFAAANYQIVTTTTVGRSADGKTIYYHDKPEMITANLTTRQVVFAAHDAGDRICFDVKAIYVASPGALFKGIVLGRIAGSSKYLIERMCQYTGVELGKETGAFIESVRRRQEK